MPAPELVTERLLLRGWRESDLDPFAAINADPEVTRFLGGPLSAEASDALVARFVEHFERHGFGLWAVEPRERGELADVVGLAGFVGLSVPRFETRFTPCVEIGWRLGRWFWGRGIAIRGRVRRCASASSRRISPRSYRSRSPPTRGPAR